MKHTFSVYVCMYGKYCGENTIKLKLNETRTVLENEKCYRKRNEKGE